MHHQLQQERFAELSRLCDSVLEAFVLIEVIVDSSGTPIDLRHLAVNAAFEKLMGLPRVELLGKTVLESIPDFDPEAIASLGWVAKTGQATAASAYSKAFGKRFRYFAWSPVKGTTAVILVDTTARHLATEAGQRNLMIGGHTAELAAIFDATRTSISVLDSELNYVFVNRFYDDLSGKRRSALLGKRHQYSPPDNRFEELVQQVLENGSASTKPGWQDVPCDPETGETRYWDWTATPIFDAEGAVQHVVISSFDVTEYVLARQRAAVAESKLIEQARLLDAIIEHTGDYLASLDRDFRIVHVNRAFASGLGMTQEELVGIPLFDLWPHEENKAVFTHVRDSGQPIHVREQPLSLPFGPQSGMVYWDWTITPVVDNTGIVTGLVFALTDATPAIRQRDQLLEIERARVREAEATTIEVAHRTKNNLQIIAGMLQLQIDQEFEPDSRGASFLRAAMGRIQMLGSLHDQMYQTHGSSLELIEVLTRIAQVDRNSLSAGDVAINVSGDIISYPARIATSMCVVANELITNAIKHSSAGTTGREVKITVTKTEGIVTLSVWGSGKPIPDGFDLSKHGKVGLKLVHSIVGRQGGQFTLTPHQGGTLARVEWSDARLRGGSL